MTKGCRRISGPVLAVFVALLAQKTMAEDISSYAFVQDDGSLKVNGEIIRLYGVYIPPTGQICYEFTRPMQCGSRAALALDFKIGVEFVHCQTRARNQDGSITASCAARGEDLSVWMLRRGWAVALPDAPFEYAAMEKIARTQGLGVWGIPIDSSRRR